MVSLNPLDVFLLESGFYPTITVGRVFMKKGNDLLSLLLPSVRKWVEDTFPKLCDVKLFNVGTQRALYLHLCRRRDSPFLRVRPFVALTLPGGQWDILYVGQTGRFKQRHDQHMSQIDTCKRYSLSELLVNGLQSDPRFTVNEINMESPDALSKIGKRQNDFPTDTNNREACRNSIGWSLASHVTWIDFSDIKSRLRVEETLIAVLQPPLNWLRRKEGNCCFKGRNTLKTLS